MKPFIFILTLLFSSMAVADRWDFSAERFVLPNNKIANLTTKYMALDDKPSMSVGFMCNGSPIGANLYILAELPDAVLPFDKEVPMWLQIKANDKILAISGKSWSTNSALFNYKPSILEFVSGNFTAKLIHGFDTVASVDITANDFNGDHDSMRYCNHSLVEVIELHNSQQK